MKKESLGIKGGREKGIDGALFCDQCGIKIESWRRKKSKRYFCSHQCYAIFKKNNVELYDNHFQKGHDIPEEWKEKYPSRWKKAEIQFLQEKYAANGTKYCAKKLKRSQSAIMHKATRLGLNRDMTEYQKGRKNKLINEYENGKEINCIDIWKREVKRRGKNTCKSCGLVDERIIVAHHIKAATTFPELKYDSSNGITLCPNCHAIVHYLQKRKSSGKRLSVEEKKLLIELSIQNIANDKIATILGVNRKTVEYHRNKNGV